MLSALTDHSVATQQCLIRQLVNQRLQPIVPLVLNGSSPQVGNTSSRCRQTVSRRSKPSSRFLLMGEQPHSWTLLHIQARKSRQRSSKPRGRCVRTFFFPESPWSVRPRTGKTCTKKKGEFPCGNSNFWLSVNFPFRRRFS